MALDPPQLSNALLQFYDALINDEISERIIPEKAFLPYVLEGKIKRFVREYVSGDHTVRYVCFTLAGEEWRAAAFFWMHEECKAGRRPFDDAYEYFVGRLLDYTEEDIAHFIKHFHERRSHK